MTTASGPPARSGRGRHVSAEPPAPRLAACSSATGRRPRTTSASS